MWTRIGRDQEAIKRAKEIMGMFERFTDRSRKIFVLANQEAQRRNHEWVGVGDLLVGMIKEGSGVAAHVLSNLKLDLHKLRKVLDEIEPPGPEVLTMGKLPQTPAMKKVIENAIKAASQLSHNYVGTEHLLLGVARMESATQPEVFGLLAKLDLDAKRIEQEILNLLSVSENEEPLEQKIAPSPSQWVWGTQLPFALPLYCTEHHIQQTGEEMKVSYTIKTADAVKRQERERCAKLLEKTAGEVDIRLNLIGLTDVVSIVVDTLLQSADNIRKLDETTSSPR